MFRLIKHNGVEYYTVDDFSGTVKHCFTTRLGGVSRNEFSSMNLRFNCGDARENVMKNFEIICNEIGVKSTDLVLSKQVHEAEVVSVDSCDKGNGILYENRFDSADALICAERGVPIAVFFADCVPIMMLDKTEGVIAAVHSGWKGTVKNIAGKTVDAFLSRCNCKKENILAAIGPSVGVCCFEVGSEVGEIFYDKFGDSVLEKREKWHVNLQKAVFEELIAAGLKPKNITNAGICTACNCERLFSHRASHGKRGNMAAIMQLI